MNKMEVSSRAECRALVHVHARALTKGAAPLGAVSAPLGAAVSL